MKRNSYEMEKIANEIIERFGILETKEGKFKTNYGLKSKDGIYNMLVVLLNDLNVQHDLECK